MQMSEDITPSLARLRDSAAKLNQLCDEAAMSVRGLEEYLAKECGVGINAHVVVSISKYENHEEHIYLSYARWGDRFRVLIEWFDESAPEQEDTRSKPWAECTREEKLLTLPHFPNLIVAIEGKIASQIKHAQSAVSVITQLAATGIKEPANAKKK